MSTILEALAVIKGKDATGGAFDAVAEKIKRLSRAASSLNRDVEKQLSIAGRLDASTNRMSRAQAAIGTGARIAAGAGAAYQGSRAATAVVKETAQGVARREHERTRQIVSGMTPAQMKETEELAEHTSKKYQSIPTTSIMAAARNVRSVVGNLEEGLKVIDPLMKLRIVAEGAHPERKEELAHDFDQLVKGMEIKGVTQDLPKFLHYMDGMAKAMNVFGDTLRPTDYYEMFKYGRQATYNLSDDFMLKTAPTLAQEMGGKSTGDQLQSFYSTVIGGRMKNVAAQQFVNFGLVDPDKVVATTTGAVKGIMPGGMKNSKLAASDPYAWVNKVFLPALARGGVTDPQDIQERIATMFGNRVAAQFVSILATQQQRIEKDWELIRQAQGLPAAQTFLDKDPYTNASKVKAQLDNLVTNAGAPLVGPATTGMNWLASGLNYVGNEAKQNPMRGVAGLGAAATIASALSLDGVLSGLAAAGNLLKGDMKTAASSFEFSLTRAAGKLLTTLAPIVDIATRTGEVLDEKSHPELFKRLQDRIGRRDLEKFDALLDLDKDDAAIDRTDFGEGSEKFVADLKAKNTARRAAIEKELTDLGYADPSVPGRGQKTFTVDDILNATGIGAPVRPVLPTQPSALAPTQPPVPLASPGSTPLAWPLAPPAISPSPQFDQLGSAIGGLERAIEGVKQPSTAPQPPLPPAMPQFDQLGNAIGGLERAIEGLKQPPAPSSGPAAPAVSIDEIRSAVETATAAPREPAKAEVIGNATLETTVTVSPSADFLARIEQKIDNKINAFRSTGSPASGSSGSTGRSMPEAGAPQ